MPIKLDVSVEMPDLLDISILRGSGLQPDEELLPETEVLPPAPVMDEVVLAQLADMGKYLVCSILISLCFFNFSLATKSFLLRFSTRGVQARRIPNEQHWRRSSHRLDHGTHYRF